MVLFCLFLLKKIPQSCVTDISHDAFARETLSDWGTLTLFLYQASASSRLLTAISSYWALTSAMICSMSKLRLLSICTTTDVSLMLACSSHSSWGRKQETSSSINEHTWADISAGEGETVDSLIQFMKLSNYMLMSTLKFSTSTYQYNICKSLTCSKQHSPPHTPNIKGIWFSCDITTDRLAKKVCQYPERKYKNTWNMQIRQKRKGVLKQRKSGKYLLIDVTQEVDFIR